MHRRRVLSPLLANVALDGMERLFGAEDDQGRYVRPSGRRGLDHGISLIRYADDLVVTAPTREVLATYVVPKLTAFLGERGLKLSEAKTRIVHIDEGVDFLGFTVRRYRGVVLTRPQKTKLVRHLRAIGDYLRQHRQATPSQVIGDLAPLIRGWANYISARRIKARVSLGGPPCQREAVAVGEATPSHQDSGMDPVEILRSQVELRGWPNEACTARRGPHHPARQGSGEA